MAKRNRKSKRTCKEIEAQLKELRSEMVDELREIIVRETESQEPKVHVLNEIWRRYQGWIEKIVIMSELVIELVNEDRQEWRLYCNLLHDLCLLFREVNKLSEELEKEVDVDPVH
jgi:hypothetical protein